LQDETEEEVLVGDISTSPEPKLRKLTSPSEDESPVCNKRTVAGTKKIVLNRNIVASSASSEKENQQQQTTKGVSDTGQQQNLQHPNAKKVVKLSAFSMKEV
jgi:hypothetical protein